MRRAVALVSASPCPRAAVQSFASRLSNFPTPQFDSLARAQALEALKLMFPHVDPAAMLDVLTQCRGNADKAAEHLLQLFPPPKKSKGFFGNLFGGAAKVAQS